MPAGTLRCLCPSPSFFRRKNKDVTQTKSGSTDVSKLQLQIVLVDKIIYPIAMANLMTTNKNNFFVALFYQMESHESSSLRTVAINQIVRVYRVRHPFLRFLAHNFSTKIPY